MDSCPDGFGNGSPQDRHGLRPRSIPRVSLLILGLDFSSWQRDSTMREVTDATAAAAATALSTASALVALADSGVAFE
eukprot:CAMPEP_0114687602 /NCGR_PEP_ID=MMETSP0191-20121206/62679_1 /TAXON_ID=126664 /ORGANISM="Sorites sp." /LENGTH=77 /DNA_ID=CAMNT_0001974323 /DNA_START=151 /DNA_END=384 /DNA_ORIENTATION=+